MKWLYHDRKVTGHVYMRYRILFLPRSTIFRLNFGTVVTVWYYFVFHFKTWFSYGVYVTFNNISVILWQSVSCWGKPQYLEKTTDLSQVTDKFYHILLHRVHLAWAGFKLTLVVIGTDCTGSCKSNYHTIMAMTAPSISLHKDLQSNYF